MTCYFNGLYLRHLQERKYILCQTQGVRKMYKKIFFCKFCNGWPYLFFDIYILRNITFTIRYGNFWTLASLSIIINKKSWRIKIVFASITFFSALKSKWRIDWFISRRVMSFMSSRSFDAQPFWYFYSTLWIFILKPNTYY